MPNVVSASIETITKRSLFIEAEMKAGEQPQCPSHSHAPGPRAGTRILPETRGEAEAWLQGRCEAACARPGTGHLGAALSPPGKEMRRITPPHGWKGLEGARGDRGVQRTGTREESAVGGEPPSPRSTPRPGTQSELGILHLKCPDLWPPQSPGRAGQGALRAEPSQKAGVLLLLHPLFPAPRDTVPTRPQDPLGPADPEAGGDPFSLPHLLS